MAPEQVSLYRISKVSKADARIFFEAQKNLPRASGFLDQLTEVSRAVAASGPGRQVHQIGTHLGHKIWGSRQTLFGIVDLPSGTQVVQILRSTGEVVVHGPLI